MGKRSVRKFVSILLVLLLVIPLMAGCGKKEGSAATTTTAPKKTTAATTGSAALEPIQYTMMGSSGSNHGEWKNMWLFEEIERQFNIRFDITQVSEETWSEKKSTAFATNVLPDLFASGLSTTELITYGTQGTLLKLNDYLDEYAPDVIALFEKYPEARKASTFPDGGIYTLTGIIKNARELSKCRFWVNTAWAEKLNVPVPTTLDEFYNFLKAVKDGDPNGNGDYNDEIPVVAMYAQNPEAQAYKQDIFIPILTAFGFTSNRLDVVDGKVIFVPAQPLYKEYLAYMRKLFTEGLLDPEYFTQTDDQRKAKVRQGLAGAFGRDAHWLDITEEEIWRQYQSIEPMTSQFNSKKIWPAHDVTTINQFTITSKAKNPERLVQLGNWFFTKEGSLATNCGVENGKWSGGVGGYEWTTNDEGVECHKLVYQEDKYDNYNDFRDKAITPRRFPYLSVPGIEIVEWITSLDARQVDLTKNILVCEPYYLATWSNNIKFTAEEASEINLLKTDLDSYIAQMEAHMISGDMDLDKFDEFVEGLKARGLERYLQICQTAYDRYMQN